ncbi:hypothetical protein Bca4012_008890 [Brassica carinata]
MYCLYDLIDRVPEDFLWHDGGIKTYDTFIYLKEFSVHLEEECMTVRPRYHPEKLDVYDLENMLYYRGDGAYDEFHSSIQNLLSGGQIVTIRIPSYDSYFGVYAESTGKDIYSPSPAELGRHVQYNGHFLLAIESSRDCDDRLFYQCQESVEPDFADNGYSLTSLLTMLK